VASAIERALPLRLQARRFFCCLVPLAGRWAGVLGLPVPTLGADPVRKVLGIFGTPRSTCCWSHCVSRRLRHIPGIQICSAPPHAPGCLPTGYALLHFPHLHRPVSRLQVWSAIVKDLVKRPYNHCRLSALLLLTPARDKRPQRHDAAAQAPLAEPCTADLRDRHPRVWH